jgi:hypothetical protein
MQNEDSLSFILLSCKSTQTYIIIPLKLLSLSSKQGKNTKKLAGSTNSTNI